MLAKVWEAEYEHIEEKQKIKIESWQIQSFISSHCTISRFTKDPQLLGSRPVKKVRNQLSLYETAFCRGEDTTDFHSIETNFIYEPGTVKYRFS